MAPLTVRLVQPSSHLKSIYQKGEQLRNPEKKHDDDVWIQSIENCLKSIIQKDDDGNEENERVMRVTTSKPLILDTFLLIELVNK